VAADYASVVVIPFCREPGSTHFSSMSVNILLAVQEMLAFGYQTHVTM
jgi:hypothetical protein